MFKKGITDTEARDFVFELMDRQKSIIFCEQMIKDINSKLSKLSKDIFDYNAIIEDDKKIIIQNVRNLFNESHKIIKGEKE